MDHEPPSEAGPDDPGSAERNLNRRDLLAEAVGAAGLATVGWLWLDGFGEDRVGKIEPTEPGAPRKTLTDQEWRTLEAACDRLLPTDRESPGARTVNAIGYMDAFLAEKHIRPDTPSIIRAGAAKLDERARRMGARDFASLPPVKQDEAVRVFETFQLADGTHPGHKWLKRMLAIILEAFFGDPVHGGNPGEVAWKWVGHKPGFPRPTEKNWRPTERGS